ncbi:hypothetical protein LCGC14_1686310 [marine sediment metagenome]|uniref:N-acetyltransferase domain-containing protein n=1 Tax=marine sediment metagenome TaxID=412755 RepID=A0A0F9HMI4_9ZZZZ
MTGLVAHPKQARHQHLIDHADILAGWVALDQGKVIVIGGVCEGGDAISPWLLFSEHMKPQYMREIFTTARNVLAEMRAAGFSVCADIDPDYPEAVRMAHLLGFRYHKPVRFPDGRTLRRMTIDARIS